MTQIILRLNYQTYFDGSETIDELLAPLNRKDLLKATSLLINRSKTKEDSVQTISSWFSNSDVASSLIYKTKNGTSILNVFSSLKLLNYVLDKDENLNSEMETDEFELRLFKAYLLLNSDQDITEELGQKNLPTEHTERLSASLLTLTYHDYDIQNYNLNEIFLSQLVKSIEYFQFIEKHDRLKHHLRFFLKNYNCKDWQEWIYKLLKVIIPILEHDNDTYSEILLEKDDDFKENILFLDLFSVPIEYDEFSDFITVRANPLLKISDTNFIILNKLFLIERIFKSVIFEFSLKINRTLEKHLQLKDFRSIYCDFFSEQILLYEKLTKCFPGNSKYIKYKGEDFKENGYSAEPDFYFRFKNKILLFESKDVILKGEEKLSRDYSVLSKGLKEKFLKIENGGKISNKAILQLQENIKRVFEKFYTKMDVNFDSNNLTIYPILVVHDRQFDAPELNRLLNTWFRQETSQIFDVEQQKKIKNLTIINIDTLILYEEHFYKRGLYGLEVLIDKYIDYVNGKYIGANYLDTSKSFSDFIAIFFDKVKFKNTPKFIDYYIERLNLK